MNIISGILTLLSIISFYSNKSIDFEGCWYAKEEINVKITSWNIDTRIDATFSVYFGIDGKFNIELIDDNSLKQYGFNFYKSQNGLDFDSYKILEETPEYVKIKLCNNGNDNAYKLELTMKDKFLLMPIQLSNGEIKIIKLKRSI